MDDHPRLSRSSLWSTQQQFYNEQGTAAFTSGAVPSHVTTSAAIAAAYARIIRGLQQDCLRLGDPRAPLYVVELGAGSARLAWRLLGTLDALEEIAPTGGPPVRFILTDVAASNIRASMAHPLLQPLIASGRIAFALRDAGAREPLELLSSGERIEPGTLRNPLVVLGNYLFDSLEHDFFRVEGGVLHEGRLQPAPEGDEGLEALTFLHGVPMTVGFHPVQGQAYEEPEWNRLLECYRQRLEGATLPFPVGALRCMEALSSLAQGRWLLLSADKGYLSEEDLRAERRPRIARHQGCVSFMLNFHAMGAWVEERGGFWLRGTEAPSRLNVAAWMLGAPREAAPATSMAFHEAIRALPPLERHALINMVSSHLEDQGPEQLLTLLRLSGWEPELIFRLHEQLPQLLRSAPLPLRKEFLRAFEQLWRNDYPLRTEEDLAVRLAPLLRQLECPAAAVDYLERSTALYGERTEARYELGASLEALGRRAEALESFEQVLAREPTHARAREARERLLHPDAAMR
ncbi:MAG: tetratricopeptide repeat protein [Myxococcaceae bacterium]|nr:tetratricopeptide repeat protein [Myxococcaceae bacterium]